MARYKIGWFSLQSCIDRKLLREEWVPILQLFQHLMDSIFSVIIFTANLNKQTHFIQNQNKNIFDLNLKSKCLNCWGLAGSLPLERKYGKYHPEKVRSRAEICKLCCLWSVCYYFIPKLPIVSQPRCSSGRNQRGWMVTLLGSQRTFFLFWCKGSNSTQGLNPLFWSNTTALTHKKHISQLCMLHKVPG